MPRIPPADAESYEPLFGSSPRLQETIWAHSPEVARAYTTFVRELRSASPLPSRLVELVRLRIAFHNQCRSCMAVRHHDGGDDGFDEALVCSLEKPAEAADLTEAERVALGFADLMATNHLAVLDETFDELRRWFSDGDLVALCLQIGAFVGFGRVTAVLNLVDDLPGEFAADGPVAPWSTTPVATVP